MRTTLLILLFVALLDTIYGQGSSTGPEVTIPNGKVRGQLINFRGSHVYQFLGIPYAEPPVKELRLEKPVPAKPWEGVLSHTEWTSQCMQPGQENLSEDCLNVNVFTPTSALDGDGRLRPVMVWIHGGGFASDSANKNAFNGTVLVALEDVVYVSLNYRLGALGFLSMPEYNISGNLGLWDQRLALKWVQENIKYFGGDPEQVTVFGESAGAMSLSGQILSPHSRGLFKNAILQSGSMYNIELLVRDGAIPSILNTTNCPESGELLSCLKAADASAFVAAGTYKYWPVFGDEFLPDDPEELVKSLDSDLNLFIGSVGIEGLYFMDLIIPPGYKGINVTLDGAKELLAIGYGESLVDYFTERYLNKVDPNDSDGLLLAIAESYGDVTLACPTYIFGLDMVKYSRAKVYAYFLNQKVTTSSTNSTYPTVPSHTDDLPFVFGQPLTRSEYILDDVLLSMKMVDIWGTFAHTGATPELGTQEWTEWQIDESGQSEMFVMELNSNEWGRANNELALRCQRDWPFPVTKINSVVD